MVGHDAIFLMGHGTASEQGQNEFLALVEQYRQHMESRATVGGGFIELATPEMTTAMDELVATRPQRITVVPLVLLPAGHMKDDGPRLVSHARSTSSSQTVVTYTSELGLLPEIISLVQSRRDEALKKLEVPASTRSHATLLVGRGSTDADANSDLFKVARLVSETSDHGLVLPAFVSLAQPSVTDGLETLRLLGARTIAVVPYFLFHGVLVDRIAAQAQQWSEDSGIEVTTTSAFGPDARLISAIDLRILQAHEGSVMSSCDLCFYRDSALTITK